ncbi:MAG: MerR family transcriptional regulator [Anaerolineaceae bacterium]|nr:MerR family transcriptional regulator [Anaerolineaceae bacterium]
MGTIAEYPTDPKYTIKAVCLQTGIRAVTLRAWERRYNLIRPQRGDNLYRLYSEQDVALLHWVKQRIDSGLSISDAVRELKSLQENDTWPEPAPNRPVVTPAWDRPPSAYAAALFNAFMKHNEGSAGDLLRKAQAGFDVKTLCLEVVIPCLVRIGAAWARGEIGVATEHYASAFLHGKLLALLQACPQRRSVPLILSGCPAGEQHELGILILALLLRHDGYRVEYLGPDLPLADLVEYAREQQPRLICLAVTLEEHVPGLSSFQDDLDTLYPAPLLGYGGLAFNAQPALRERVRGHFLGETLVDALQTVHALLDR